MRPSISRTSARGSSLVEVMVGHVIGMLVVLAIY